MADKSLINNQTLTDIADAIRQKTNTTDKLKPSQMAAAITSITASDNTDTETVNAADIIKSLADKSYNFGTITAEETAINSNVYSSQNSLHSYSNDNLTAINVDSAFANCFYLTSVDIPRLNNLTKMSAFSGCSRLETVNIGAIAALPNSTFYACNQLKAVPNADIVTSVGQQCFSFNQGIKTLYLPVCETINPFAFAQTSIRYAVLPSMVNVGGYIFASCGLLEKIDIGDKCKSINNQLFSNSQAQIDLIIRATNPPTLNGLFAFGRNGRIKSIKVPSESVDKYKAAPNWMNYIDIITAITDADVIAVEEEKNTHTETTINHTNYRTESITRYINSNLESITVEGAFLNNLSLHKFYAPNLKRATYYILKGCRNLTTVNIDSLTTIPAGFFSDCVNLKDIPNKNQITFIGEANFNNNLNLVNLDLPKCQEIQWYTFANCANLETVIMPSAVTVRNSTFANCHKLKLVDLGINTKYIHSYLFEGANCKVKLIIRATTPPELSGGNRFIMGNNGMLAIKVPASAVDTYKNADGWRNVAEFISAID